MHAYCPDIFSLYLLAINFLSKQVIRLLWLVWVTAVIYFFNRFEWSVSEICSDIRAQPENNPQIEVLVGNLILHLIIHKDLNISKYIKKGLKVSHIGN